MQSALVPGGAVVPESVVCGGTVCGGAAGVRPHHQREQLSTAPGCASGFGRPAELLCIMGSGQNGEKGLVHTPPVLPQPYFQPSTFPVPFRALKEGKCKLRAQTSL